MYFYIYLLLCYSNSQPFRVRRAFHNLFIWEHPWLRNYCCTASAISVFLNQGAATCSCLYWGFLINLKQAGTRGITNEFCTISKMPLWPWGVVEGAGWKEGGVPMSSSSGWAAQTSAPAQSDPYGQPMQRATSQPSLAFPDSQCKGLQLEQVLLLQPFLRQTRMLCPETEGHRTVLH